MDDFFPARRYAAQTLDQIARINKRLGAIKQLSRRTGYDITNDSNEQRVIRIADWVAEAAICCGLSPTMAGKNKYRLALTGIDNNDFTVNYARKCSAGYPDPVRENGCAERKAFRNRNLI